MEDSEQNRLLRETLQVEKENNRLLRKMHRDALLGRIFTLLFWGVSIGLPLVLYYLYISPYIKAFQGSYQSLQHSAEQAKTMQANLPPWAQEWLDKALGGGKSTTSPESSTH